MSLECYVGPERNLLATTEQHAHRLLLPHPILTNEELAAIKHLDHRGWKSKLIDITYARTEGEAGLAKRLDRICREAEQAIDDGYSLVVLSDRGVSRGARAGQLAAGRRRGASSPDPPGQADADRHHPGIGRGPRGASPLPARRLRGRRDQSLPGVRGAVAGAARRPAARRSTATTKIVHAYQKAVAKGMLKVMSQDGHLDAAVVQGSADFRGGRPERRSDREVLCRHGQPDQGRAASRCWPRRPCGGTRSAIRSGPSSGCRCCRTLASSTGGPKASGTCGTRSRSPICRSPPARTAPTPIGGSRKHANEDATRKCALARPAEVQDGRATGRFRLPKSSRRRRSSSGSAPGR